MTGNSELPLCQCFAHLPRSLAFELLLLLRAGVQDWYNYIATDVLGTRSSSSSSTGENPALGDLLLSLTQGSHSLTGLEDENPLDIFDYLGNIGGFWGECMSLKKRD